MGEKRDLEKVAKARRELEELYMGVPDESVNLTFGYLADVKKQSNPMDAIVQESSSKLAIKNSLNKLPSLDFNRALQPSNHNPGHYVHDHRIEEQALHGHRFIDGENYESNHSHNYVPSPRRETHNMAGFKHVVDEHSMAYNDVSGISMSSMSQFPDRGGRRRPGIPHSTICTICSTYIYIFRNRCLVCGRVYCRSCVSVGMGEMTEGRKCVDCLGRRFSQRYIQKAGKTGCCWRYPSMVKQQELKWAEKGPRRNGEKGYGNSVMMSRSISPITPRSPVTPRSPIRPRTPTKAHYHSNTSPSSFVMDTPYSAYSPTRSPIPF